MMKIDRTYSLYRGLVMSCILLMLSGIDAYADRTAIVNAISKGGGKVYVSTTNSAPSKDAYNESHRASASKSNLDYFSGDPTFYLFSAPNEGYILEGWSSSDDRKNFIEGSDSSPYKSSFAVANNWNSSKTYNMYAFFRKKQYTVTFGGNGATSGSMNDQTFIYGEKQELSENKFTKTAKIEFDTNGGNAINPQEITCTFGGWSLDATSYEDKEELTLTYEEDKKIIKLTAIWNAASITLPKPTKKYGNISIEFDGWYDAQVGGERIGGAGDTYTPSENKKLYAHWKEHDITIKIKSTSFKEGDTVIFDVKQNDNQKVTYAVPIAIGATGQAVLKNVPAGNYTIQPNKWAWDYTISPASRSETVNANKTVEFTVTSKNSTKNRDEKSKVNWGNGN